MIKRLLMLMAIATAVGGCAPVMQRASQSDVVCLDAATQQTLPCPSVVAQADLQQPQDPPDKKVKPGPGKKDFSTWLALLTMGFAALYLMAFR